MKPQQLAWVLLMPLLSILVASHVAPVSGQCPGDQQSLLLQLKQSLNFSRSFSGNLAGWNSSIDCCNWLGITCDLVGGLVRVVGLNLSNESITGGLDNSIALFSLQHLQVLDLSFNSFNTTIPTAVSNLTNLRHLNLSSAGFYGQIPSAVSQMSSLVSLDLSTLSFLGLPSLKLENPNLAGLVQNLKRLTDLRLDGPIDFSLSDLESLSVVRLDNNNFSDPFPDFFADFRNLTILRLTSCGLVGKFPAKILQIPSLEILDLSNNKLLEGEIPDFPQNHYSMQTLLLTDTNFSGKLPSSLGNLGNLSRIELSRCNFSGTIPRSLENLAQLNYLDFSSNNLIGPIPSAQWGSFQKLEYVDLRHNSFNGSIPPSLFSIPTLQKIQLSFNQLKGPAPEFSNASSSILDTLDLSSNHLEGPVPRSIFEVQTLKVLVLSSNRFNGTVQLNWIQALQNLTTLDLSYNNLTVDASGNNNSTLSSIYPQFGILNLASSNLSQFPELGNQSRLTRLDLSGNNINGVVPRWILETTTIYHLNLSHNNLVDFQVPISLPNLGVLDMHHNKLEGEIPIIQSSFSMIYVDYSNNFFNSSIPVDISNYLPYALFFSLSNNRLSGAIPASICNASYLQVLDLSNNTLTGTIPSCLMENIGTLAVLNLRGNKVHGSIPDTFQASCSLQTLDLSLNQLNGRVPKSLSNCTALEVLDLGNNMIDDVFPCLLKNNSSLRVLILRNNLFHGSTGCPHLPGTWQKLQIVDLAFNNFSGPLNGQCLATWQAMMVGDGNETHNHLKYEPFKLTQLYYQDSITVTSKGLEMELVKVLTVFTSVDFSSNNFDGPIPAAVGQLNALYILNFSHNGFTGQIPAVFGNISQLESLDLSDNKLSGEIPQELTELTFLSFVNLSNNNLLGKIPTGRQFLTFDNTSYQGNPGLCGSPLMKSCSDSNTPPPSGRKQGSGQQSLDWEFIIPGIGFGAAAATVMAPLIFSKKATRWCDDHIDRILMVLLPLCGFRYYTSNDWRRVQPEDMTEEYNTDLDDDDEEEEESYDEFGGRYCVYCTKLDMTRKMAIHDPKCSCHHLSRPVSTFSSPFSSTTTL
ncbi:unnamed protein product [Linum tenue]|uniref:Leucine-rich repeat-containing N-terminal plant-type domain-containing protein n=1 Tax=Linum tenue TaxID=586396 RepID=A0AAV0KUW9_9ROSI|nr:unnamed protein product [Linum tenue]